MKLLITLTLLFNLSTYAGEGVSTEIDPNRISHLLSWAHNAKLELTNGLDNAQKRPVSEQELYLRQTIEILLPSSGTRKNEFLMRNILYRTIVLHDILLETPHSVKRDAVARRILQDGIEWAIKLYQVDTRILPGRELSQYVPRPVEFAQLGLEWAQYMLSMTYNLPDNNSALKFLAAGIGLFYNDIADDAKFNRALAPVLKHIVVFQETDMNTPTHGNIETRIKVRRYRTFLEQEIKNAQNILGNLRISSINEGNRSTYGIESNYAEGLKSYLQPRINASETYHTICILT